MVDSTPHPTKNDFLVPFQFTAAKRWLTRAAVDAKAQQKQAEAGHAHNGRFLILMHVHWSSTLFFAGLVQRCFQPSCQLLRRAYAPIMQKEDPGLFVYHMIVYCDHFNSVFYQRFDYGSHFIFEHSEVPGHCSMIGRPLPGGPGIEAKKGGDGYPMFFQPYIGPSYRVLVHAFAHRS